MNASRRMALCGMLTALAVVILLLGGLLPLATFCAPVLAMAALLPVLEECGPRAAGIAWAATSLLALLLAADREMATVMLFFGWYPILRPRIARMTSPLTRLAAKVLLCSALIALLYSLLLKLMGPATDLAGLSPVLTVMMLVLANLTFLLLDVALGRLTALWHRRLRNFLFH